MSRTIRLTKGFVATVDGADFKPLSQHYWHAHVTKNTTYARSRINGRLVYMHRLLLSAPRGKEVDHVNSDGLDNRRSNIRLCTKSQNNANRRSFKGTSRYKGVYFDKKRNRWVAEIQKDGRRRWLGMFEDESDAGEAYRNASLELFGEFSSAHSINEMRRSCENF